VNYYVRNIGDFARDTGHLSLHAKGVYDALLDKYYSSEKPIPDARAEQLICAQTDEDKRLTRAILKEFFKFSKRNGGEWVHKRCEIEISKLNIKSYVSRENGKKGGRPPKEKPSKKPSGFQKPTGFSETGNLKTLTINHYPLTNTPLIPLGGMAACDEPTGDRATAPPAPPSPAVEDGQDFAMAWNALSRWSEVATRFPIPLGHNHERSVRKLIASIVDQPPIIHGDQQVPQAKLIPLAVERLMSDENAKYKSPAYACKCIQNLLDEWAKQGMRETKKENSDPCKSLDYTSYNKASSEFAERERDRILAERAKNPTVQSPQVKAFLEKLGISTEEPANQNGGVM